MKRPGSKIKVLKEFPLRQIVLVVVMVIANFLFSEAQTTTPTTPNLNTSPGKISKDTSSNKASPAAPSNSNTIQINVTPLPPNATNPNQTSPAIPNPNINESQPPDKDSLLKVISPNPKNY
ncbi:MAG: hypothetical protein H0W62_08245 [Chitinophagales bacterium]|nr:hypothetical protein [Chitinophagales bacterium]